MSILIQNGDTHPTFIEDINRTRCLGAEGFMPTIHAVHLYRRFHAKILSQVLAWYVPRLANESHLIELVEFRIVDPPRIKGNLI